MRFSNEEMTQMMRESAPELVHTIEMLITSGETVKELEEWSRTYIAHKYHSKVMGEDFIQVIHHLAG